LELLALFVIRYYYLALMTIRLVEKKLFLVQVLEVGHYLLLVWMVQLLELLALFVIRYYYLALMTIRLVGIG